MIFVVLGMHKSGTTLISRMLHESGINMGEFDPSVSYDHGNQYERIEFQQINKELLCCGNTHSTAVIKPLEKGHINTKLGQRVSSYVAELNEQNHSWGFKDPRTCLTFDFWSEYLPDHKKIYVFRSPVEIWNHYQKKIPAYRVLKRFFAGFKGVRAWHIYNSQLVRILNISKENFFLIEYSDFMNNVDSINELSKFTHCDLKDSRDLGLYRAKKKAGIGYNNCLLILKILNGFDIAGLYSDLYTLKFKQ